MSLADQLVSNYFGISDGQLVIGDVKVKEIIDRYSTPFFVYLPSISRNRVSDLRKAIPDTKIFYAMKANPTPAILKIFIDEGCGIEIASGGELFLALKCGCPASKIVFAGPGKKDEELNAAIDAGVLNINIESMNEIDRIAKLAGKHRKKVSVSIRVNPSDVITGGAMIMGGKATAFGIDEDFIYQAVDGVLDSPELVFSGLHFFSGTQILDYDIIIQLYEHYLKLAEEVANYTGIPMKILDFGGGFGVPYFDNDKELDLNKLGLSLKRLFVEAKSRSGLKDTLFIIEPGRYLIAETGVYITSVLDRKTSKGKEFLILDGGMNHHIGASGHLGQILKRNFPIVMANRMNDKNTSFYEIAGPLCTPLDILGHNVSLPDVKVGDVVAIFQSGAYVRSASPINFLSHPEPMEIFIEDGNIQVVRQRGVFDDLLRGTVI